MPGKLYLVIGSNCFTGSHIVDSLLEEPANWVIGISRSPEYKDFFLPYKQRSTKQFQFHQIDLIYQFDELTRLLDQIKPQVVINVAALSEVGLSNERPVEYFETNTLGVVRLCNFLRSRSYLERYVHISSAEVYGNCETPATEETHFNPSTAYAASKAAADLHLNTLVKNFGFPAIIIRTTNVYGRHQQLYKLIPRVVIYLKLGKMIELHAGGKAIKAYVHIRDVVRGIRSILDHGKLGTFHFTASKSETVGEIVRKICTWMGYEFENVTRPTEDRGWQDIRYWLDYSKSERELGWREQVPFERGVKEVIEWIEDNWQAVQGGPLVYIHKEGFPLTAVSA